ncbi:MAG: iron-sulfur cluster assembly accessory protein [Bacteroidota bacterium]
MVTVSDKARERLIELRAEEGYAPDFGVRVSVKGGGCSGLSYDLGFDNETQPGDQVFEHNGIQVIVNAKSLLYLVGTQLDFTDGLNGKGFEFNNPNASRTCACGESFAV